ncbi:MAG: glycosyltransferase family 4 protein [Proteobacteria bacterium]|nr:glycosyltransferase family 4 protein [Pseudomonadota bacterium]MBU1388559.1 glycosyltransferase family 4 protein [Pseudomonadota bacterium]MBU1544361.1 glycosyltransferase family 4 protein [Pseudomonadota bacterium]
MPGILIFFHNSSNSGFASRRHEGTFSKMAFNIVGDYKKIHFAYTDTSGGRSSTLPTEIVNIIQFDSAKQDSTSLKFISQYIKNNNITVGFGFDQPVRRPAYKVMRKAGMHCLISYVGAPMSSLNSGLKLFIKRLDVKLSRYQPDHYIFQSEGMRKTATHGRGIPVHKTSVVLSGTDPERYKPSEIIDYYAHDTFKINHDKKIVFFSGNMESRKGVDVIVKTAAELINKRRRFDVHFLLVGNRWDQAEKLMEVAKNTEAEKHITFGGYRDDVPKLLRSCYAGIIASTGWDSYPMSAVEMAATGLPVMVSDLPGLREAVTPDTGLHFPPGDYLTAADHIQKLLDCPNERETMGKAARKAVLASQTVEHQAKSLETIIRRYAFER